jgi:hypothetical protein
VRVLAVPKLPAVGELEGEGRGERRIEGLEVVADRRIVGSGPGKCLFGEFQPLFFGEPCTFNSCDDLFVIRRVDYNGNVFEVLCRRPDHGRASHIDVLDQFVERKGLSRHLLERVKVDNQEIDPVDAVLRHYGIVDLAPAQKAAVDFGVERLYPPVHHFGKPGIIRDFRERDLCLLQRFAGTAGTHEGKLVFHQCLCQFHDPGLIPYRK